MGRYPILDTRLIVSSSVSWTHNLLSFFESFGGSSKVKIVKDEDAETADVSTGGGIDISVVVFVSSVVSAINGDVINVPSIFSVVDGDNG